MLHNDCENQKKEGPRRREGGGPGPIRSWADPELVCVYLSFLTQTASRLQRDNVKQISGGGQHGGGPGKGGTRKKKVEMEE